MLVAILLITVGGLAGVVVVRTGVKENQRTVFAGGRGSVGAPAPRGGRRSRVLRRLPHRHGWGDDLCESLRHAEPRKPAEPQGQAIVSGGYTRDWSIVDSGDGTTATANHKTIRVRVRWTERGAQQLIVAGAKGW